MKRRQDQDLLSALSGQRLCSRGSQLIGLKMPTPEPLHTIPSPLRNSSDLGNLSICPGFFFPFPQKMHDRRCEIRSKSRRKELKKKFSRQRYAHPGQMPERGGLYMPAINAMNIQSLLQQSYRCLAWNSIMQGRVMATVQDYFVSWIVLSVLQKLRPQSSAWTLADIGRR